MTRIILLAAAVASMWAEVADASPTRLFTAEILVTIDGQEWGIIAAQARVGVEYDPARLRPRVPTPHLIEGRDERSPSAVFGGVLYNALLSLDAADQSFTLRQRFDDLTTGSVTLTDPITVQLPSVWTDQATAESARRRLGETFFTNVIGPWQDTAIPLHEAVVDGALLALTLDRFGWSHEPLVTLEIVNRRGLPRRRGGSRSGAIPEPSALALATVLLPWIVRHARPTH